MPSHAQPVQTYKSLVTARRQSDALTPLKQALANAEKFPKSDITGGALGAKRFVYAIKVELYLEITPIAPNAKPQWFKAGPAPLF
jgi:hypothetical protein